MFVRTTFILFVFLFIYNLVNSNAEQRGSLENVKRFRNSSRWGRLGLDGTQETTKSKENKNNDEIVSAEAFFNEDGNDDQFNQNTKTNDEANQTPSTGSDDAFRKDIDETQSNGNMKKQYKKPDNEDQSEDNNDENSEDAFNEFEKEDQKSNYNDFNVEGTKHLVGETRSIRVGDTFTPPEMLPIASKLMKKVRDLGSKGKGIVSSAIYPKHLADTLFERYFMTMKRIVILKDVDICGLDALQALALSGDLVKYKSPENSYTESPANAIIGGNDNDSVPKCHYKLLSKPVNGSRNRHDLKRRRGRVNLTKNLAKKRKLIVNTARKRFTKKNHRREKNNKRRTNNLKKLKARSEKGVPEGQCRWSYECKNMLALDTCRLHADCSTQGQSQRKFMGIKINEDEDTENLQKFRKMIGVDIIDEEVEKILESRFLSLHPKRPSKSERIESLADYFNKIVIRERLDKIQTTPHPLAQSIDSDNQSSQSTAVSARDNGMNPEYTVTEPNSDYEMNETHSNTDQEFQQQEERRINDQNKKK